MTISGKAKSKSNLRSKVWKLSKLSTSLHKRKIKSRRLKRKFSKTRKRLMGGKRRLPRRRRKKNNKTRRNPRKLKKLRKYSKYYKGGAAAAQPPQDNPPFTVLAEFGHPMLSLAASGNGDTVVGMTSTRASGEIAVFDHIELTFRRTQRLYTIMPIRLRCLALNQTGNVLIVGVIK